MIFIIVNLEENVQLRNRFLDKFVRTVHDLDMYLVKDNFGYTPTVIVYPYKFLKNSPEYNSDYASLMYTEKIQDIFEEAMSYIPFDDVRLNDRPDFVVSKLKGSYLEKYIKDIEYLTPMFFESDYIPEDYRGYEKNPTVKFNKIWFHSGFLSTFSADAGQPHFGVSFDVSGKGSDLINIFEKEFEDYLSNNMNVDEEIRAWFMN